MRALNIAEEGRVANLTRVVTAATLTENVPTSAARQLKASVRAVRLYAEASERRLANAVLTEIIKAAEDLPVAVGEAVTRHAESLRKHWRMENSDV